jgi:hypothetical protein
MEKHHKLRRPAGALPLHVLFPTAARFSPPRSPDARPHAPNPPPPGSSIHGCNICGKEGHQAAHCPNGTVGWETKWPREAFILEEPQWYCEPNYEVVAKVAKEWADKRRRQLAGGGAAAGEAAAQLAGEGDQGGVPGDADGDAHGGGGEGPTSGAGAAAGVAPPPPGGVWQTYYDALGRPYFFQAQTNTTVWALPPGAVALPGVPPVAGAAAPQQQQQQQQQQMGAGGLVQAQAQAHQTVGA